MKFQKPNVKKNLKQNLMAENGTSMMMFKLKKINNRLKNMNEV